MYATRHVFVKLDKPLNDEIITQGGIKFFIDPRWQKEWHATVTGTVAAIPRYYTNIKEGDEIAFSYKVVDEKTYPNNGKSFQPHFDLPNFKEFINGKGERLRVIGMVMPNGFKRWAVTWLNSNLSLIDGTAGTESHVERYISQFSFGYGTQFTFKNLFEIDDTDLWKCTLDRIMAKKTPEGIESLNGSIIVEPMEVDLSKRVAITNGIHIPDGYVVKRYYDRGKVVSGNDEFNNGEIVGFEEQYAPAYDLWGKKYLFVKPERIHSTWLET